MPVIGDRESRFRVNVRPTNGDVAQQNYGAHLRFVSHTAVTGRRGCLPKAILEFCEMKFQAREGRAGGMANTIFPRLPCRRRFESMPAAATSKTRRSRGH
jgi:hypothetical protein